MKTNLLLVGSLTLMANAASAQSPVGAPQYVAGDCGEVSHAVSDDWSVYNMYYNGHKQHAEGEREAKLDKCLYRTKIHVPKGKRVALKKAGYKGYRTLRRGDVALHVSKAWMQKAGTATGYEVKTFRKEMKKPTTNEMWSIGWSKDDKDLNWSACGQDVYLYSFTAVGVQNRWKGDKRPYAGVTKGQYQLEWQECKPWEEAPVEIPIEGPADVVDQDPTEDRNDADDPTPPADQDNGVDLDGDDEIDAEGPEDDPFADLDELLNS